MREIVPLFLASNALSRALTKSRKPSWRTSYGVFNSHGFACTKAESLFTHKARNAAIAVDAPLLKALTHSLYVQRAAPIIAWSRVRCSFVGNRRIFFTVMKQFAALFGTTLSGVARHKDGTNGQRLVHVVVVEIVAELALWPANALTLVVNQESAMTFAEKQPFHKSHSEATQALFAGNHNFRDRVPVNAVQKGNRAGSCPLATGNNVDDDVAVGVVVEFAVQICFFVLPRESCVTDELPLFRFAKRLGSGAASSGALMQGAKE